MWGVDKPSQLHLQIIDNWMFYGRTGLRRVSYLRSQLINLVLTTQLRVRRLLGVKASVGLLEAA